MYQYQMNHGETCLTEVIIFYLKVCSHLAIDKEFVVSIEVICVLSSHQSTLVTTKPSWHPMWLQDKSAISLAFRGEQLCMLSLFRKVQSSILVDLRVNRKFSVKCPHCGPLVKTLFIENAIYLKSQTYVNVSEVGNQRVT